MKTEPGHDTMFEALVALRNNLHEKLALLDEQIRSAQLKRLEESFRQQSDALAECLDGIDQQLMALAVYVDDYRRLYSSLNDLNEKIPHFGGSPHAMPEAMEGEDLTAILAARLDRLKSQAKI